MRASVICLEYSIFCGLAATFQPIGELSTFAGGKKERGQERSQHSIYSAQFLRSGGWGEGDGGVITGEGDLMKRKEGYVLETQICKTYGKTSLMMYI